MKTMMLTARHLKELLHYDPSSGEWSWLVSRGSRRAGAAAGNRRPDGYKYIKIDKVLYRSTRLIWVYQTGKWPAAHVDHEDGDTSNDRWDNLRDATRSQNLGNRKLNKNSVSGFKGVSKRSGRYRAYINKDGKRYWLGYFDNPKAAHAAYMAAASRLFGEFARAA